MRHAFSFQSDPVRRGTARAAAIVAGLYLIFAVLWILLSDRAVTLFVEGAAQGVFIQTIKGLVFVAASAGLIWWLVYRTLLRQARAEAEEARSRRLLAEVLDAVNDGVWEHDIATGALRWFGQWEALTGYRADALLTPESFVALIHPDDRDVALAPYFAMAEGRASTFETEYRLRAANGRWLWVRARGRVTERDENGRPRRTMGIFTDLTVIREAQERLSIMVESLTRSETELERYAHATVHDLRQPIRQMVSYAHLLARQEDGADPALARDYAEYLREGGHRLGELLDSLQEAFEQRHRNTEFDRVDLDAVARNALDKLRRMIERSGARVDIGPLPQVSGDAVQLTLLFEHLIGNALKFRSSERAPVVTVTADHGPEGVTVTVEDNGIGFPQEEAERLFLAFNRLHPSNVYPGSGMGLALCLSIVRHHGGTIKAHGEEGTGARFVVMLPQIDGPACAVDRATATP